MQKPTTLTATTIQIVKSTAPILAQHGEALTRLFYRRMFERNPEVAPFFNPAHQAAGTQQKALASAICAYAANIDNLGALGGAVELIAQKHASLQVKAEHYPIVGANLLAAIRELLGPAATDEIINAWGEAYSFLAGILIAREHQIYREDAGTKNGWEGFKKFRVLRKVVESDVITSFYLEPSDRTAPPLFKPGQYLTIRVPSPCGHTTMRNYSLSDKPGQPWLRISVKRESARETGLPDGFVSNFLHHTVQVGSELEVGPPCGEFTFDPADGSARPLVLLSGGVGITPLISILLSALDATPNRHIIFVHGTHSMQTHAFHSLLSDLEEKHSNLAVAYCYQDVPEQVLARNLRIHRGHMNEPFLRVLIPDRDAEYYFCGPKPFMSSIHRLLRSWNVPSPQMHFEFFGPRQELEAGAEG
jgi:nitric oxide dioxygenase